MKKLIYLCLAVFLIAVSCKEDPDPIQEFEPPICTDTYVKKSYQYEVVGFYPSWRHSVLPIESVKWDKLTRVIYCFAVPAVNGGLSTGELFLASQLVSTAHANGVEAVFSIGGAAGSSTFVDAVSTPEKRKNMIERILTFLGNNCFDGVDIDYETYSAQLPDNILTDFMKDLYAELPQYGYSISIDVYPSGWSGKKVSDEVVDLVDYVYIMGYNFSGPWSDPGPHSSYEQCIGSGNTSSSTGLAYWANYRGWDKNKLVLGVPFYGRDFDVDGGKPITYKDIIALDPTAAYVNQWNNIYYDGIDAVTRKAEYIVANNFPGMMIWELGQDAGVDSLSLLTAMDGVLNP